MATAMATPVGEVDGPGYEEEEADSALRGELFGPTESADSEDEADSITEDWAKLDRDAQDSFLAWLSGEDHNTQPTATPSYVAPPSQQATDAKGSDVLAQVVRPTPQDREDDVDVQGSEAASESFEHLGTESPTQHQHQQKEQLTTSVRELAEHAVSLNARADRGNSSDLVLSLSSMLQITDGDDTGFEACVDRAAIAHLCSAIGYVPERLRRKVWGALLASPAPVEGNAGQYDRTGKHGNTFASPALHEDEIEEDSMRAKSDSACIRFLFLDRPGLAAAAAAAAASMAPASAWPPRQRADIRNDGSVDTGAADQGGRNHCNDTDVYDSDDEGAGVGRCPSALEVRTLFREFCAARQLRASECDAGLGDVLCVLCSPGLDRRCDANDADPRAVLRMVTRMCELGLLHLRLGGTYNGANALRTARRSSAMHANNAGQTGHSNLRLLVGDLLCFHDRALGTHLSWATQPHRMGVKAKQMKTQRDDDDGADNGDEKYHDGGANDIAVDMGVPWRWWRCALAGEVPPRALMVLWDHMLLDRCAALGPDVSPPTPATKPFAAHDHKTRARSSSNCGIAGASDGADPRGPLVAYVILSLLLQHREGLMAIRADCSATSRQAVLDVARAASRSLTTESARELCSQAMVLRSSTPLHVIPSLRGAQDAALAEADRRRVVEASATATDADPGAANDDDDNDDDGDDGTSTTTTTTKKEEEGVGENDATVCAGNHGRRPTAKLAPLSFSDRIKLTLGVGKYNAATLLKQQQEHLNLQKSGGKEQGLKKKRQSRANADVVNALTEEERTAQRQRRAHARHALNGCARGSVVLWDEWMEVGVFDDQVDDCNGGGGGGGGGGGDGCSSNDRTFVSSGSFRPSESAKQYCACGAGAWVPCVVLVVFHRVVVLVQPASSNSADDVEDVDGVVFETKRPVVPRLGGGRYGMELIERLLGEELVVAQCVHGAQFQRARVSFEPDKESTAYEMAVAAVKFVDFEEAVVAEEENVTGAHRHAVERSSQFQVGVPWALADSFRAALDGCNSLV